MADEDRNRRDMDLRHYSSRKLMKMLKKNEQIASHKKKAEEKKAKAKLEIEALERELKFREVLEDLKRLHARAVNTHDNGWRKTANNAKNKK